MDTRIDPATYAAQEIALLNKLFQAQRIRAGIDPDGTGSLIAPQYWSYLVQLDLRETPESIHKLHLAIANLIANHRQAPTPVRITDAPVAIEVPALQPRPISWRKANWQVGPGCMIAGKRYSLFGGEGQIVIDLAQQPHILVAGATGAGKSMLLQMLLVTLAVNTPPNDLEMWFCDLKNDDLVALRGLPHVRCQAINEAQAAVLIDRLHAEKDRRIATHRYDRRILLVVDEQAELSRLSDSIVQMNSLLSVGRSIGISLLIATQEPTKSVLGGLSSRNITTRLVGAVADADAARYATGRARSGAELLTRPGGFLRIAGPETDRFQSYLLDNADLPRVIRLVQDRWPGEPAQSPATPILNPQPQPQPQPDPIPAAVVETFRDYYDETSGQLRWGGLSAIIRAMFGPGTNTGGAYKRQAEEMVERLKSTTTTAYAADFGRYQPQNGRNQE